MTSGEDKPLFGTRFPPGCIRTFATLYLMNRETETCRRPRNAPQTSKWQQHLHHLSQGACFTWCACSREKGAGCWKRCARVRWQGHHQTCVRGFPWGDTRFTPPLSGERAPLWCSAFALQVPGEERTKLGILQHFHPPLIPRQTLMPPHSPSPAWGRKLQVWWHCGKERRGSCLLSRSNPWVRTRTSPCDLLKMCWWEASLETVIPENASRTAS